VLFFTVKYKVLFRAVTAGLQKQANNKIHPDVSTVPRHPTVIVLHLCCKTGKELLAVQPILLWLSERVLQSELSAVTLVISGTL
jgi:hypothetical protein